MTQSRQITIDMEELKNTLETLVRKVVREELERAVKKEPNIFYLESDMPIYKDMEEIRQRKEQKKVKLYSHGEVWG